MADIMGSAVLDISAEFDASAYQQGLARVQHDLKAFQEGMGSLLSSAAKTGAGFISSMFSSIGGDARQIGPVLRDGLSSFLDAWRGQVSTAGTVFGEFTHGLGAAARAGMDRVRTAFTPLAQAATTAVQATQQVLSAGFARLPDPIQNAIRTAGGFIVNQLPGYAVQGASALVSAMGTGLSALGSVVGSAMRGVGGLIAQGLSSAGSAIMSAMSTLGAGAAKAFSDAMSLGVKAVGVGIGAILGTSLTKGFGRLKAIDNAEASLRGLAATANHVPEIMNSVTAAVSGTAFGLDQGAKAATLFAAAGVPIGDMERHIGALANTAAAAGGDFDGMSSIFAKVAARGSVTTEVLNQMTDRGLAGLSSLAAYYGVTAEEAQKMVTKGEVSFDDFSKAMDQAMGAVAIEQAKTFTGLMSNVGAAMGRLGAVMQKPFFEATKAVLPGVMNLFNQLKNVIAPLAQIISDRLMPAAEALGEKLSAIQLAPLTTSADKLFGSLALLAPVVGALAAGFAGPLLSSIPVVGSLFSGLTGPVGLLLGAFVALFAVKPDTLLAGIGSVLGALPQMLSGIVEAAGRVIPEIAGKFAANAPMLLSAFAVMIQQVVTSFGEILPLLVSAVPEIVGGLATALVSSVPILVGAALTLVQSLVGAISGMLPELISIVYETVPVIYTAIIGALPLLIQAGVDLLTALVAGLLQAIPLLLETIPVIFESILAALTAALPIILGAGVQILLSLLDGILQSIPILIDAVTAMIPMLVTAIVEAVPLIIEGALTLFMGIIDGILLALPLIIESILAMLPVFLESIIGMLPMLINAALTLFLGIVDGIVQALPQIISMILQMLPQFLQTIIGMLPQLIQAAFQLFVGIVTGIIQALPQIISMILRMLPQFVSTIIGMLPQLIQAAFTLFLGLVTGIIKAVPQIISTILTSVKGGIMNLFAGAGTWLLSSGKAMLTGLADGIRNGISNAINAVKSGLAKIRSFFPFSPAKEGPFSGKGWTLNSGAAIMESLAEGVKREESATVRAVREALSSVQEATTITVNGASRSVPVTVAAAVAPTVDTSRLAREDLDYLADRLANVLWPMARTTDTVNDLVANGPNRRRRGYAGAVV